jgi:hypothetical protein
VGTRRPLAYHSVVYRSCTLDYRNHPVTAAPSAHNQGKPVATGLSRGGQRRNGDRPTM